MGEVETKRIDTVETAEKQIPIHHEIRKAFDSAGYPLRPRFDNEMGGYSNESQLIEGSELIKQYLTITKDPLTYSELVDIFSLPRGTYKSQDPASKVVPPEIFRSVYANLNSEPAKIFVRFLGEVIYRTNILENHAPKVPELPYKSRSLEICERAEINFTKYALTNKHSWPWPGANVDIVTEGSLPVAIVKRRGLGAEYSTLTLSPLSINNATIPAGSILSADYMKKPVESNYEELSDKSGKIIPHTEAGFKFHRFSQFTFDPEDRKTSCNAYYKYYKAHAKGHDLPPEWIDRLTIKDFFEVAKYHLNSK